MCELGRAVPSVARFMHTALPLSLQGPASQRSKEPWKVRSDVGNAESVFCEPNWILFLAVCTLFAFNSV